MIKKITVYEGDPCVDFDGFLSFSTEMFNRVDSCHHKAIYMVAYGYDDYHGVVEVGYERPMTIEEIKQGIDWIKLRQTRLADTVELIERKELATLKAKYPDE